MGLLAASWMIAPVSALLSLPIALAIAWPRARFDAAVRRRLAIAAAMGAAHLVPWALGLALDMRRSAREEIVAHGGTFVAAVGILVVIAVVARGPRGCARALAWLPTHALFLGAYLSDVGRDGIGQML
jgi:hypothetical protein